MFPNLAYSSQGLYVSNQVRSGLIYLLLSLSATSSYTKDLCHLVNTLTPNDYNI